MPIDFYFSRHISGLTSMKNASQKAKTKPSGGRQPRRTICCQVLESDEQKERMIQDHPLCDSS